MDVKKLTNVLLGGGGAVTCVALLWWAYFYEQVVRGLTGGRGSLTDALSCLYSSGGPCGFVSGMAQLGGATPYSPVVFWVGAVLLGIGIILRLSAGSPPGPSTAISPADTGHSAHQNEAVSSVSSGAPANAREVTCSGCGAKVYASAGICDVCGKSLV